MPRITSHIGFTLQSDPLWDLVEGDSARVGLVGMLSSVILQRLPPGFMLGPIAGLPVLQPVPARLHLFAG